MGFAALPSHIVRDPTLSATAKTVLMVLSTYTSANGTSWPSAASVAAATGLSPRQVFRVLAELRERELVTAYARFRASDGEVKLAACGSKLRNSGRQTSSVFGLNFNAFESSEPARHDTHDRPGPDTHDRPIKEPSKKEPAKQPPNPRQRGNVEEGELELLERESAQSLAAGEALLAEYVALRHQDRIGPTGQRIKARLDADQTERDRRNDRISALRGAALTAQRLALAERWSTGDVLIAQRRWLQGGPAHPIGRMKRPKRCLERLMALTASQQRRAETEPPLLTDVFS
jgi:hypothetical protein